MNFNNWIDLFRFYRKNVVLFLFDLCRIYCYKENLFFKHLNANDNRFNRLTVIRQQL